MFGLAIPIASVAWTHEEVFRETRQFCVERSQQSSSMLRRKFFYLFTCEYCFSHWVTAFLLVVTRYKLLLPDRRGYTEFANLSADGHAHFADFPFRCFLTYHAQTCCKSAITGAFKETAMVVSSGAISSEVSITFSRLLPMQVFRS